MCVWMSSERPTRRGEDQVPTQPLPVELGSFTLTHLLGSGGMGEVWAGTHRALGMPVAVKVVRGPLRDSPAYQRAFRNEVRAIAALDHPNVVRVVDTDRIPESAARMSGQRLEAGAPYLVMERLHTDLRSHAQPEDWRFLRDVGRDLLRGLAHAHARGILHRDVKPANVLLDQRGRARLTDFGLAQLRATEGGEAPETAGTPTYMAPEQLFGRWRDAGPWTDLYAVGTVLWELAAGSPPFGALMAREAVRAHAVLDLPSLMPRMAVPSGLEAWLRRLLRKDQDERFQCAADALYALDEVDRVRSWVAAGSTTRPMSREDQPTELTDATGPTDAATGRGGTEILESAFDSDLGVVEPTQERTDLGADTLVDARPPPISLEIPERPAPSAPLLGAGLGLVHQRPPPLVGRGAEQRELWSRLVQVHRERGVHAMWLRGPTGYGKTRLADWLLEEGHAEGAAHRFRATHRADGPHRDGLVGLLASELDAVGLAGNPLRLHLADRLARIGCSDDLAAVLSALDERSEALPQRALHGLVQRILAARLTDRPGALLLDDVALSADSLAFVRFLVRGPGRHLPLLVLLTTDDELLAERPGARAALDDLLAGPRTSALDIGPLDRASRRELVRGLLGVDSPLVDRVEAETSGHPLFAVELVRGWVEEGSITAFDGSYRLAREARKGLPPDLARVWRRRLRWALRDRAPAEAAALEVAAVLGDVVAFDEWERACVVLGLPANGDLVDILVDVGLAERTTDAAGTPVWTFSHRMVRQAILERVARHDRTEVLHAGAAKALEEGGPETAGRRGRHLLAAGHLAEAVGPLVEGMGHAIQRGDPDAEVLLDAARDAMQRARVRESDPAALQLLVHEGALAQARLDGRAIHAVAKKMLDVAERLGHAELALRGNLHLAAAYRLLGRHRDAVPLLEAGAVMARVDGADDMLVRILHLLGTVQLERGRGDAAEAAIREAVEVAEAPALAEHQVPLQVSLVQMLVYRGNLEEAAERIGAALVELGPDQGTTRGKALMLLGEVRRHQGDLRGARHAYEASKRHYLSLGHEAQALFPALNAALVGVLENRFVEAEAEAREVLRGFQERNADLGQVYAHAVILPCAAATGRWGAFDRSLTRIEERVAADGLADLDVAFLLVRAARFARQAGRAVRGEAALTAAKDQYRRLGRHEEADRLR